MVIGYAGLPGLGAGVSREIQKAIKPTVDAVFGPGECRPPACP